MNQSPAEGYGHQELPDGGKRGTMATTDYLVHLQSVPLFAQCTRKQLADIARVADELALPAGKEFVRQGEIGVEMFILVSGTAEVSRDGRVVAEVFPGHFIGELAVLSDVRRNATVRAKTDIDVLVLTRRGVDQLLDEVPGFAKQLLREVVSRVVRPAGEPAAPLAQ